MKTEVFQSWLKQIEGAVPPEAIARQITNVLATAIIPDAILCTDGNPIYAAFARQTGLTH